MEIFVMRRLPNIFSGAILAATVLFLNRVAAAESGVADDRLSPDAQVRSVGLDEARWTQGLWAERFALCRQRMIPAMWQLMAGTNYTQFYQNFRIAAGLEPGRHHGAPFNDGDFYKWLEGASAMYAQTHDPRLGATIEQIVGVIGKAQRADGYLQTGTLIRERDGDTNAVPFQNPNDFEMYNLGHLMTAACVNYRATGQTNLLAIACRAADFLDQAFQHPTPELARNLVCPSHYMGIVELYRTTHNPRYLALAKQLFAMRDLVTDGGDDNQDRVPFPDQDEAVGHAVRANYLYAGAADLFLETGDPALWKPLGLIWTNVVGKKMYLTGGCGALWDGASPDGAKDQKTITRVHQAYGRNYQLPNLTAYCETCANIGNVMWNWRMFLATGQAKFMDVVELALDNSVLSGGGLDGTNYFYVNPLRQLDTMPTELRWPRTRVPFLNSFCCPPNLVRTIAESANYIYAKSGDTILVNLYGGSVLDTTMANGRKIKLTQETDYPWNGRVRITINQCDEMPLALKLRIPGWAGSASVRINDRPADNSPAPGTYFEIRRTWRPGDFIDLDIPMPVEVIEANPLVEDDLHQVAVKRGPVVYCLESTALPRNVGVMQIRVPTDVKFAARYDRRLLGGVVALDCTLQMQPASDWDGQLY
ncbi:MAG TPA: glycoside hydrolase family 127 protein, partial [Verrucomicrobiae bacterium]|nr:glycoside hydrolase family 127 protein [Verrucomicrobiae bacterium]